MEQDFDMQFASDEDVEELLDALLEDLRDDFEEDENRTTVLNPLRLTQMKFVYSVLKYLTRGTSADVTYKLNEPFKTMGSVSAEAYALDFINPKWLARAAEFASNTEVYPLAKNKIRLTFTFHGLTVPID